MERPAISGEGAKLSKQERRNLNKQKRKALEPSTATNGAPPIPTPAVTTHVPSNAVKRHSSTNIEPVHKKSKPSSEEGATSAVNRVIKPASLWNFAVDYNDHFETPAVAYIDIQPLLQAYAAYMNKTPADLLIYDPYWCEGSVVAHLRSLGFLNVINSNRDFYADIKKKCVPGYDMLVTNPPYSGEHKVNLLKFLAAYTNASTSSTTSANAKAPNATTTTSSTSAADAHLCSDASHNTLPFALLLPVYVATKSYWKDFVQQQHCAGREAFYILPPDYYEYSHPEGTGKDIPPFYSAWFVGGFATGTRARVIEALRSNPRRSSNTTTATPALKKLSFSSLVVVESIEGLVQRGVVVDSKRPNPKRRHKMKAKLK